MEEDVGRRGVSEVVAKNLERSDEGPSVRMELTGSHIQLGEEILLEEGERKWEANLLKMAEEMKVKGTLLVALSSTHIGMPQGGMHTPRCESSSLSRAHVGSSASLLSRLVKWSLGNWVDVSASKWRGAHWYIRA